MANLAPAMVHRDDQDCDDQDRQQSQRAQISERWVTQTPSTDALGQSWDDNQKLASS